MSRTFHKCTIMRQTQLLIQQTPIHTEIKITSRLQKFTHSYLQTLLLEKMLSQMYVTIQMYDMMQIQLFLQMWIVHPNKMMKPFKMKVFHVAVNTTYDLILSQTFQTHKEIRQVPNSQLIQWHTKPLIKFLSFHFLFLGFLSFEPLLGYYNKPTK